MMYRAITISILACFITEAGAIAKQIAEPCLTTVRTIFVQDSGYTPNAEPAAVEARKMILNKTCFTLVDTLYSADAILRVKEESAGGWTNVTTMAVPIGPVVAATTAVSPNPVTKVTLSLFVKSENRVVWEKSMEVGNRWLAPQKLIPKLAKEADCKHRR